MSLLVAFAASAAAQDDLGREVRGVARLPDGSLVQLRGQASRQGSNQSLELEARGSWRLSLRGTYRSSRIDLSERVAAPTTTVGASGNLDNLFGMAASNTLATTSLPGTLTLLPRTRAWSGRFQRGVSATRRAPDADLLVFPLAPAPSGRLSASVGRGGANRAADVRWVQSRLNALGFHWVGVDGSIGPVTIHALRAFQAMTQGNQNVSEGRGLVRPGDATERWLRSRRAPRWILMPREGVGFKSLERLQTSDDHDYGTDWLNELILVAGVVYQREHRDQRPGASVIWVNDAARDRCRDTRDHAGHETGISIDIGLPRTDGSKEGCYVSWGSYDRAAARAILKAFRKHPRFSRAFLNDRTLIREGLCVWRGGHSDHMHIELSPPSP